MSAVVSIARSDTGSIKLDEAEYRPRMKRPKKKDGWKPIIDIRSYCSSLLDQICLRIAL